MRVPLTALILGLLVWDGTTRDALRAQSALLPERALAREIFRELIEIPTTAGDSATPRAAEAMANRLIGAGFPREDVHVLNPVPGVGTLVARLHGTDRSARPILLMAHMDVVPAQREDWSIDPWTLTERDGWFYGRGTTDNKAGASMLVSNFVRFKREGWQPRRDVIVALTGDEETTQASIQLLLKQHRPLVDAEFRTQHRLWRDHPEECRVIAFHSAGQRKGVRRLPA